MVHAFPSEYTIEVILEQVWTCAVSAPPLTVIQL